MNTLKQLGLLILAAIALIAIGVIVATGHSVPDQLWTVTYVLVGGVAGVTVPTAIASATTTPAAVPQPPSSGGVT